MKTRFVLFILLFHLPSLAATVCSEFYNHLGAHNIYRRLYSDLCLLSISPSDTSTMIYRSFSYTNFGSMMVFNSYGPEDNSAATGARVYYFFPRTRLPDILVQGDFVTVQTATPGVDFTFSRTTGLMTNFSAGNFIEEPVAPTNSGGIQLQLSRGLMLDVGYARGYDPSTKPTASSVFYDGFMHKCSVKNSMLFKYLPDGDIVFNMSDLDLDVFLKRQCPQLVYTL